MTSPAVPAEERLSGGATTHLKKADKRAFSHPAANIRLRNQMDFRLGHGVFRKLWVPAPSSTTASDGLGPLYNARSCMQCHSRGGKGNSPVFTGQSPALLFKLSIPAQNAAQAEQLASGHIGSLDDPIYGNQLQEFAITGINAEAKLHIDYTPIQITLNDGEQVELLKPQYQITDSQYGPLHQDLMTSPRIASSMIGLGLLENIPASDIRAQADPNDINNDGISGRANRVRDNETQRFSLGRFGWKAGAATLNQQNNAAFNTDIGISTPYARAAWGDCTEQQQQCRQLPNGNSQHLEGLEASSEMNKVLLFYTRHIAVPARRDSDHPETLAGKQLFMQSGCAQCHTPSFTTAKNADLPYLSQQQIWPYSDLLLHDMGAGLADNRPEFQASGREWRTPPLWGIGLIKQVNPNAGFLHDGRARTLLEAILWHGGEAETAKQNIIEMSARRRQQLIRFLRSL